MLRQNVTTSARIRFGLSFRIIAMIVAMIFAIEMVIYLPSVANFRIKWLDDRVEMAGMAFRVIEAAPDDMALPPEMVAKLLSSARADAFVFKYGRASWLVQHPDMPMPDVVVTSDIRNRSWPRLIASALEVMIFGNQRTMRVIGTPDLPADMVVEILMSEELLREEMLVYSRNIFWLSVIAALTTSGAIFVFLNGLLVQPIRRMIANMIAFRHTPEDGNRVILPSGRKDEMGIAEQELAMMERNVFSMLREKQHLADLGLAVAKINHDLRNMLAAAQMLSDKVATLEDPRVQQLAPRLVNTLDRANAFTQSVLDYGRREIVPPAMSPVDLRLLVDESAIDAGIPAHPSITLNNKIPDGISINVDPDQYARIFVNLIKNAREALESQQEARDADGVISVDCRKMPNAIRVDISDNGPGLSPRATKNLFVAFEGAGRTGGTGLGLVIAREIARAHGGDLALVNTETGTTFRLELPVPHRAE